MSMLTSSWTLELHDAVPRLPDFFLARATPDRPALQLQVFLGLDQWQDAILQRPDTPQLAVISPTAMPSSGIAAALSVVPPSIVGGTKVVLLLRSLRTWEARCAAALAGQVQYVLIEDREPVLALISALLHDFDSRECCADALRLLHGRWGEEADRLLESALGSRLRYGLLKSVASQRRLDRSTVRRHTNKAGVAGAEPVLIAARVAVSALLSWRTSWSGVRIGRYLYFADERPIGSAVDRMLGTSLDLLRAWPKHVSERRCCKRLVEQLDRYVLRDTRVDRRSSATPVGWIWRVRGTALSRSLIEQVRHADSAKANRWTSRGTGQVEHGSHHPAFPHLEDSWSIFPVGR